jgi:hypothetical protein
MVLTDRERRLHRAVMLSIVGLALIRGLFWVVLAPVWNPVDETAHFGYVESLARGHGIPVVGEDFVSPEVLAVAKQSPTYFFRSQPYRADPHDPQWGGTRHLYEGIQGPVYYALMTPAYWASRPFGFLSAVYGVRVASLLLALVALPLTRRLARELFPHSPATWLAGPALLAVAGGFNSNLASVSNDALAVVASAAMLTVAVRGLRSGSTSAAAGAGVLLGLCVVNKTTALELLPVVGLAWVWTFVRRPADRASLLRWVLVAGGSAALTVAPWVIFNLFTYGAPSAAEEVRLITGGAQGVAPLSFSGLSKQWTTATGAFWEFQPATPDGGRFRAVWWSFVAFTAVVGLASAVLRRGARRGLPATVWAFTALPLAFGVMMGIVYGVTGGEGLVVGRHLYPILPLLAVGVAAGWFALVSPRAGLAAFLVFAAVLLPREGDMIRRFVDRTYAAGIRDAEVPVIDQSFADRTIQVDSVVLHAPCPTRTVGVGATGASTVATVDTASRTIATSPLDQDGAFALFSLPERVAGDFRVRFNRSTNVLASGRGPVVRVYCPVADPESARFSQLFREGHPGFVTYGMVRAWSSVGTWVGAGLLLGALALIGREGSRAVRVRRRNLETIRQ